MARTKYIDPVAYMTGKISNKGRRPIISRHKLYRDDNGEIIAEGPNESYMIKHPRNYEKKPMKSGEMKTIAAFQQAAAQYKLDKQDPQKMEYWKARFNAQFPNGDPSAPIDPETKKRRIYGRLDMFIRAMLQLQFRNNA